MTETTRPGRGAVHPATAGRASVERLSIRNYDGRTAHDVTVSARPIDGEETTFERDYHLAPDRSTYELDGFEPGTYVVEARTESGGSDRTTCRVDDTLGGTVMVEIGNGAISVSEGFR